MGLGEDAAEGTVEDTIKQRGPVYGDFLGNSVVSQSIKEAMRSPHNQWRSLPFDVQEALDYIAGKISRIVTGNNAYYKDNWTDIAGYATLVLKRIEESEKLKLRPQPKEEAKAPTPADRFKGAKNAG